MTGAAFPEMGHNGLHPVQGRLDVDGHHLVEVVVSQVEHLAGNPSACIVDPHIHLGEGAQGFVAHPFHVGAAGHIRHNGDGVRPALRGHLLELCSSPGREDDLVATPGQQPRGRCADAAARPGNHNHS